MGHSCEIISGYDFLVLLGLLLEFEKNSAAITKVFPSFADKLNIGQQTK